MKDNKRHKPPKRKVYVMMSCVECETTTDNYYVLAPPQFRYIKESCAIDKQKYKDKKQIVLCPRCYETIMSRASRFRGDFFSKMNEYRNANRDNYNEES